MTILQRMEPTSLFDTTGPVRPGGSARRVTGASSIVPPATRYAASLRRRRAAVERYFALGRVRAA